MSPEYLEDLADLADPDQLWRRAGLDQMSLPTDQRRQLDMGVALRRHADHVRQLRALIGTGQSLLLTPLSPNGTSRRTVPTPPTEVKRGSHAWCPYCKSPPAAPCYQWCKSK